MAESPSVLHVDLLGQGPFSLPVFIEISSLEIPEEKDSAVAEFLSHDKKRIFATISYCALEQFVNNYRSQPIEKSNLVRSAAIELSKPADAYELPIFSFYEGFFFRAPKWRTLIFSTEQRQRVLFPLQVLTFDRFLKLTTGAVLFYKNEKRRH
jgi:hypothetical protein